MRQHIKRVLGSLLWKAGLRERVQADVNRLEKSQKKLQAGLRQQKQNSRQRRLIEALKDARARQRALTRDLGELRDAQEEMGREAREAVRLARVLALARHEDCVQAHTVQPPRLLPKLSVLKSHLRSAVEAARLENEPFPYLVIREVLPRDFYGLLLDAIPPQAFWREAGTQRQNWFIGRDPGPRQVEMVWGFVHEVMVPELLIPLLVEKFQHTINDFCRSAFGMENGEAQALRYHCTEGRLLLRRPGYAIAPHLDPRHAMLTTLVYLPRPDQDTHEEYGTMLFKVKADQLPVKRIGIFYPERAGIRCELAKTVPYEKNSALVFFTPRAVHGAKLPAKVVPAEFERLAYQFLVSLDKKLWKRVRDVRS